MPAESGQRVRLKVCTDSVAGVRAAAEAGADRVELCAGLVEGGTTPSAGTIALARETSSITIMVLVRPRRGDFLYSSAEMDVMRRDIRAAAAAGANGVVLGLLMPDATIDLERTRELIELARPMEVTFHRAFDMTRNAPAALEALISLGVERVLTSGQAATAAAGAPLLAQLVAQAGDRVSVMPGGGIRADNARAIVTATGAREIHFTARARRASKMEWRNDGCGMGAVTFPGEYELLETDSTLVRHILSAVT